MDDIKQIMRKHYLRYASYVILDRAIPDISDGLKPVQRRILHVLWRMHDGKLHKVANVAGQTMAFHPHGDAPIVEALVNLANKGFLLDTQGNFGNLLTGDPHAAARYIETRLSPLAHETLFNPELTSNVPSYDGRHQEPVLLPSKIPVLLMHGAEGIAVGMATQVLPHNFVELLHAQIACLEERPFTLLPDFPTGGIMDGAEYAAGRGRVRLRAQLLVRDPKTIMIKEICYGTTTESLIRSIDEAAKRGKIKIEAIHDYTAAQVEIEIKLPRGQQASEVIDALYAFTECQVNINSQIVLIKDNLPWEGDVHEILRYNTVQLQDLLKRELELEKEQLKEKVFERNLEQIFIEERLYKQIEEIADYGTVHQVILSSLQPFLAKLARTPTSEDLEKLLSIPIRRITRFDIGKNQKDISELLRRLAQVERELMQMRQVTIRYLQKLLDKYGQQFPRRTRLESIEQLDKRALEVKNVRVGFDASQGFIGTKVSGSHTLECQNVDKLLLFYRHGIYKVINIPEKLYVGEGGEMPIYVGIADKKSVASVAYRHPQTLMAFAKRFVIDRFVTDRPYRFFDEEMQLLYFSTEPSVKVGVRFVPVPRQKQSGAEFAFDSVLVKGVAAKGVRLCSRPVAELFALQSFEGVR